MLNLDPLADPRPELLADMFRLLGDPSRLKLVLALCEGASAASAAATRAGLSPQLASHHLRLLKAARLVRAMRKGREIHYDIADDHVRHMLDDMVAHVSEPHHDEKG